MTQEPIAIPRFVALVTAEPIERETVKAWFSCVRSAAPAGIMLAIPTTDDRGLPQTVCLVHRETSAKHFYMIPLTRDLEDEETAAIVAAFSALGIDGDFEVEASASHLSAPEQPETGVVIDENKYLELCMAWAKRQHELWMKDRIEQGWRYGTELSISSKTNPLLRPFEQLPDQYRKPNLDEPQALLDLLNDQGYAVITRDELASMLSLMRQSAAIPAAIEESIEDDAEEIDENTVYADRLRRASMASSEKRAYDAWNGTANMRRPESGQGETGKPAPSQSLPRSVFGKRRPST